MCCIEYAICFSSSFEATIDGSFSYKKSTLSVKIYLVTSCPLSWYFMN